MNSFRLIQCLSYLLACAVASAAEPKKIVLVAGTPSHGPGDHEFNAGSLLLKKCLDGVPGVNAVVQLNGWPRDETVFEGAAAIMIYADGGSGHPAIRGNNLQTLGKLMDRGVGLACVHYGVEVPRDNGGREFLNWIGGYFETHWSVNPHWTAEIKSLPDHPITRGVKPFSIRDEWYFHMRFVEGLKGVTPILSAVPPASTMERGDGPHSGNPAVRRAVAAGELQHLAWAFERPGGGRGFGFTGAHPHNNWGHDDFRKIVLNALLWVAQIEVPPQGVQSTVTTADLEQNLDPKGRRRADASAPPAPRAEPFVSPVAGDKK